MADPTSVTLIANVKTWLKIETDADDANVTAATIAAEEFAAGYTGVAIAAATPATGQYLLAVYALAGLYLDNREAGTPLDIREIPFGVRNVLDAVRGVIP